MKLASIIASIAAVSPTYAQQCIGTPDMYATLDGKYKEERKGLGFTDNGAVVEFWVSESGTWTVVATFPDGVSCGIASGDDWSFEPEKKEPNL